METNRANQITFKVQFSVEGDVSLYVTTVRATDIVAAVRQIQDDTNTRVVLCHVEAL